MKKSYLALLISITYSPSKPAEIKRKNTQLSSTLDKAQSDFIRTFLTDHHLQSLHLSTTQLESYKQQCQLHLKTLVNALSSIAQNVHEIENITQQLQSLITNTSLTIYHLNKYLLYSHIHLVSQKGLHPAAHNILQSILARLQITSVIYKFLNIMHSKTTPELLQNPILSPLIKLTHTASIHHRYFTLLIPQLPTSSLRKQHDQYLSHCQQTLTLLQSSIISQLCPNPHTSLVSLFTEIQNIELSLPVHTQSLSSISNMPFIQQDMPLSQLQSNKTTITHLCNTLSLYISDSRKTNSSISITDIISKIHTLVLSHSLTLSQLRLLSQYISLIKHETSLILPCFSSIYPIILQYHTEQYLYSQVYSIFTQETSLSSNTQAYNFIYSCYLRHKYNNLLFQTKTTPSVNISQAVIMHSSIDSAWNSSLSTDISLKHFVECTNWTTSLYKTLEQTPMQIMLQINSTQHLCMLVSKNIAEKLSQYEHILSLVHYLSAEILAHLEYNDTLLDLSRTISIYQTSSIANLKDNTHIFSTEIFQEMLRFYYHTLSICNTFIQVKLSENTEKLLSKIHELHTVIQSNSHTYNSTLNQFIEQYHHYLNFPESLLPSTILNIKTLISAQKFLDNNTNFVVSKMHEIFHTIYYRGTISEVLYTRVKEFYTSYINSSTLFITNISSSKSSSSNIENTIEESTTVSTTSLKPSVNKSSSLRPNKPNILL